MRKYMEAVSCEWCTSSADFESVEEAVQEGWIHLEHDASGESHEYDFCSWDCLVSYL